MAVGMPVRISLEPERPTFESAREDDLRLRREDMGHRLDRVQNPLQVAGIRGPNLEQVVRLAGQMVALLDLFDLGEIARQICGDGARNLLDEYECQDGVSELGGVDERRVTPDDSPALELLDPLVGGRPAHADCLAYLGIRSAAVSLEEIEDASVSLVHSLG